MSSSVNGTARAGAANVVGLRWGLGCIGAIFVAFGLASAVSPDLMLEPLGVSAPPVGRVELRATYGGVQLGFGLLLTTGALFRRHTETGFLALALIMTPIGLLRAAGVVLADAATGFHIVALAFEFASAALGWYGFHRSRRR